MSTYNVKPAAKVKSVWIIVNGIVGTAHKSRTGEWVDFRPAKWCAQTFSTHDCVGKLTPVPAKGVVVEYGVIRFNVIDHVEYRIDTFGLEATITMSAAQSQNIAAGFDGDMTTTFTCRTEVPGWPLPAEMQAEIAAADAAREASWQAYQERRAAGPDAAVRAWAEALPADSQERRWVQRWLRTGKAYDQVFRSACAGTGDRYHGSEVEKALSAFKKEVIGE